jgi:hypothetical protein
MKGDLIDDAHLLARYCRPSTLNEDKSAPTAAAFARKVNHSTLSVNDVDFFVAPTLEEQLARTRDAMSNVLNLSADGRVASVRTANVRAVNANPPFRVLHDPVLYQGKPGNEAHCGIENVPSEVELAAGRVSELLELLAAMEGHWRVGDI